MRYIKIISFVLFIQLVFFLPSNSNAKIKHHKKFSPHFAALIIDASSNRILYHKNAMTKINPASLTKMMTIYLAFEQLKKGNLSLNSELPISRYAASMPKTNIDLRAGKTISLKKAILSMVVKSANDSAVVIAESIAGSEKKFVAVMNKRAKQLGMNNTNFTNASGWHHQKQKTTALDMARLAIALRRDYAQYYHLFSRTSFYYKNKLLRGHNKVLTQLKGADGLKTGYTSKAGWNLVTSAQRGRARLIGVIIGGKSLQSRDQQMITMLNTHFKKINNVKKVRPVYATNQRKQIALLKDGKRKTT